mmetsp:Transcript_8298/g.9490  ORF Transcript_8298/g.9490 Transcript_8298/m.9490 type:complete len:123 (+) Transcript_8298:135-503(+)
MVGEETKEMVRQTIQHIEQNVPPRDYQTNMHAMSLLYMSHLRNQRRSNHPMSQPNFPHPHPASSPNVQNRFPPHFQPPFQPRPPQLNPQFGPAPNHSAINGNAPRVSRANRISFIQGQQKKQ